MGRVRTHSMIQKKKYTEHTVLLIDDDADFCELLAEYLQREGFFVRAAHDGHSGYEAALDPDINIIILDVMLPKMNGFDVLKKLKGTMTTPVLMLTAKGDEADQLIGLTIGADDYLPKPCSPKLLVARLRAILRRVETSTTGEVATQLMVGNIQIDLSTRIVMIENSVLELTNSEYNILCCLVKNSGKIVAKELLSEQCLNRKIEAFDRSVDMHISHLRNKLDQASHTSPRIRTVRGIGYFLEKK